jgi:hypothetical protein
LSFVAGPTRFLLKASSFVCFSPSWCNILKLNPTTDQSTYLSCHAHLTLLLAIQVAYDLFLWWTSSYVCTIWNAPYQCVTFPFHGVKLPMCFY